jgi:hypothetical protein
VHRDTSPPSAPLALFTFVMLLAPVTNWEPHGVTLAGYCYGMRHGVKVQIVTPYRVGHWQRYGVKVRGNVTSAAPTVTVRGNVTSAVPTVTVRGNVTSAVPTFILTAS